MGTDRAAAPGGSRSMGLAAESLPAAAPGGPVGTAGPELSRGAPAGALGGPAPPAGGDWPLTGGGSSTRAGGGGLAQDRGVGRCIPGGACEESPAPASFAAAGLGGSMPGG